MQQDKILELKKGLTTAFIDQTFYSNLAYKPQFIYNDNKNGQKVFSSIEDELKNCDQFAISVAFITRGGITPLLQTLKELEQRKIPGRILTTDYLCFSDPVALDKIASLSNITLRMYQTERAGNGFHTKGYIFQKGEEYRFIIGSSNLTQDALTRNIEWNTKMVSASQGEMINSVRREFEQLWSDKNCVKDYEAFIEEYRNRYAQKQLLEKLIADQKKIAKREMIPSIEAYTLQPNSMQQAFIYNLLKLRNKKVDKALLISATGTGKTYAAAFAMRELGFHRVLFLVHRNQIARQAKTSFERVFGSRLNTGLISGKSKDYDADYIFATVQTLSKPENLQKFHRKYFDACIYDEAHHTSADSYKKIMDYFEPEFTLGMTATPDKRDDQIAGRNIYEIFDHNIAYEIRLQQAMEEDLLCPFHYFGITDLSLISDEGRSKEEQLKNFRYLTSDERVKYVMEQAAYFGYSGNRVKGLIFCSRIEEAQELSKKFNERGWHTIALSGADSEEVRAEAIERLTMEIQSEEDDYLDYIITVDIFSEGTDIVEVNQVIMLRPTQSPIVFIQQLGRGLRKSAGKEYVVVLDFIGNYKNNFMIPIALSGDRTYNKDNVRRYLMEGGRMIPGASTIHFDEISRKRIYESIDRMSTTKSMLAEHYSQLKERLGKIPTILDFYFNGEIDPMLFVEYSKSYDQFVRLVDKEYKVTFSQQEESILEFVSNLIMNGKRIHELLMLKMLLDAGEFSAQLIQKKLDEMDESYRESDYNSACRVITKEFINSQSEKKRYEVFELVDSDTVKTGRIRRTAAFYEKLKDKRFAEELSDLTEYGICRYHDLYADHDENNLVLYQKYSRKDVCRILNWAKDDSATVYGYRIKYNTCPIFVTYEKSDDISDSTKYLDEFEKIGTDPIVYSNKIFSWMTRSKVKQESPEAQELIHAKENGLKILLFLKKSDGEGTDFYYMGEAEPVKWEETTILNDKKQILPIMNFKLELKKEVRKDIFDYFTA